MKLDHVHEAAQVAENLQNLIVGHVNKDTTAEPLATSPRAEVLLLKIETLISQGSFNEALELLNDMNGDVHPSLLIQALCLKGIVYWRLARLDEALKCLEEALEMFSDGNHSPYLQAACLHRLGNVYHRKGQLNEAMEKLHDALNVFKQLNNQYMIASCLNSLGSVFYSKGDYKNAAQFYEEAIGIAKQLNNQHLFMLFYNNMGLIQWNLGRFDDALAYFEQSHELLRQMGDMQRIASMLDNMALIYRQRGELDRALEYQLKSLQSKKQIGNMEEVAVGLKNIGMTYYEYDNETLALQYLRESLDILNEINNPVRLSEVIFYLIIVLTDMNPIPRDEAEKYLSLLEKQAKENPQNIIINQRLACSQAISTFKIHRDNNKNRLPRKLRVRVEYVLSSIIDEDIMDHEIIFQALVTLIAFYLEELQQFNEVELFSRLKELLNILVEVGEQQRSMSWTRY